MDKLAAFYILIPLIVAYLAVEYRPQLFALLRGTSLSELAQRDVVIGVLSARDHFGPRAAIRETWWGHVNSKRDLNERVDLKFVVGNSACEIPVVDRVDPYGCVRHTVTLPEKTDNILAVTETTNVVGETHLRNYGIQSLAFKVHHPVILSKLGMHGVSLQKKVSLRLLDAATQTEIISTVLSRESPGVLLEGFRYKAVEPYLLPQGFEGLVVGENLGSGSLELDVTKDHVTTLTNDGGGVIKFMEPRLEPTHEGHYTDPRVAGSNLLSLVSFIYTVHEVEVLKAHLANASARAADWVDMTARHQRELHDEAQEHGDVLLVDMVDVYRHVPLKLVRFYQWLIEEWNFGFALKTDDDCFVDVERILTKLSASNLTQKSPVWWGRFRQSWAVEHYGKWAEVDYPSIAYPSFACGSGSLLSGDMVRWIVDNVDHLKMYQGEDVSLGIWMAAVAPHLEDDPMFQCEKLCISDMLTLPDLSPDELRQVWTDRLTCGDPCGCS